ncbi:MAG: hypothetical protein GY760_06260 [Deltaproteobacteria bacterium]|nr:hypothetical protein [Deltaproteobacteria bacterium]
MNKSSLLIKYESLFDSLEVIIKCSENRVVCDTPDELFIDNVNFFVKSYIISICTYLEAYLQDIAYQYIQDLNERISQTSIPHNYVLWKIRKEVKSKELKFQNLNIETTKKELSDNLSGNPYKTITLFKYLGVDITCDNAFQKSKALVSSIVIKRNNIIHHNDKAMDISFSDLFHYIETVLIYMNSIDQSIAKN